MHSPLPAQALIIGVGNRWRRDDGAGPAVAEALAAMNLGYARVLTAEGEGATLLELWRGEDSVVVIDAAAGPPPGTIQRFDARRQALPPELFGCSSHAFGVAQAVELARALDCLPRRLLVYALGGRDFGLGEGLSPEVATAVPALAAEIARDLAQ